MNNIDVIFYKPEDIPLKEYIIKELGIFYGLKNEDSKISIDEFRKYLKIPLYKREELSSETYFELPRKNVFYENIEEELHFSILENDDKIVLISRGRKQCNLFDLWDILTEDGQNFVVKYHQPQLKEISKKLIEKMKELNQKLEVLQKAVLEIDEIMDGILF